MSDAVETKGAKKRSPLRWLLLALIFSPLTCCGGIIYPVRAAGCDANIV